MKMKRIEARRLERVKNEAWSVLRVFPVEGFCYLIHKIFLHVKGIVTSPFQWVTPLTGLQFPEIHPWKLVVGWFYRDSSVPWFTYSSDDSKGWCICVPGIRLKELGDRSDYSKSIEFSVSSNMAFSSSVVKDRIIPRA